jgi:cellobiose phosphorylase
MKPKSIKPWEFIRPDGAFRLEDPQRTNYLYLPLVNEAGMISVVTPGLHGDTKTGQHTFLTQPESVEDLHNTRSSRNFWVYVEGAGAWSAAGASAAQAVAVEDEQVTLEIGFLWQKLVRTNPRVGLRAEITNLVPPTIDQVELMRVTLTNITDHPLKLTPTAAIPIYGRSADNLRDHRHVTSLLQRIRCQAYGVLVRPTLSFDERGHQPNTVTYAVLGAEGDGAAPAGFFPVVEDFIGEGGALDWPQAILQPGAATSPAGTTVDGYEALGGLRCRQAAFARTPSSWPLFQRWLPVRKALRSWCRLTPPPPGSTISCSRQRPGGRPSWLTWPSRPAMKHSTCGRNGSPSSRSSGVCSVIPTCPTTTTDAAAAAGAICGRIS